MGAFHSCNRNWQGSSGSFFGCGNFDSLDYLGHDDSPVHPVFRNRVFSRMASQVGIAFSAAIAKPDRDDPYLDILFHVNEYTAAHLDGILGDIRKYLGNPQACGIWGSRSLLLVEKPR